MYITESHVNVKIGEVECLALAKGIGILVSTETWLCDIRVIKHSEMTNITWL